MKRNLGDCCWSEAAVQKTAAAAVAAVQGTAAVAAVGRADVGGDQRQAAGLQPARLLQPAAG